MPAQTVWLLIIIVAELDVVHVDTRAARHRPHVSVHECYYSQGVATLYDVERERTRLQTHHRIMYLYTVPGIILHFVLTPFVTVVNIKYLRVVEHPSFAITYLRSSCTIIPYICTVRSTCSVSATYFSHPHL